ncbi:MAG: diguanylate cyclase [Clostridia bacterium]|nr:diguanylate cyclase [Clostridia bacterium]
MEYSMIGATFVSGMILSSIGIYVLLEGRRGKNLWFSGFALAAALHSFGYAFELTASTVEMAFIFIKIEYLGIAFQSFFGILAIIELTGNDRRFDKRIAWGMLFFSLLTVILVHTNNLHHLYYADLALTKVGALTIMRVTPGIWYKVFVVYVELCFAVGITILARAIAKAPADLKPQYRVYLMSFLAPAIGSLIYLLGLSPYDTDLAPCYLLVMSALLVHGLNGNQLFNVVPLAQRRVIDSMNDIVVIISKNNRIVDHNPSLNQLLFCASRDHLGEHLSTVFSDYPEILEFVMTHSDDHANIALKDGSSRAYRASVHTILGRGNRALAKYLIMTDITNEMRTLQAVRKLANLDSLTHIANRRSLHSQVKELKKRCVSGLLVCAIMIDIDDFKPVNDEHGHSAGDMVLREIASILKTSLRSQDILARYGGEEFIVIAPGIGLDAAVALAERLREKISDIEMVYENHTIRVTVSVGVAGEMTGPGFEAERLVGDADAALYEAKKLGKNRVVPYRRDECECKQG